MQTQTVFLLRKNGEFAINEAFCDKMWRYVKSHWHLAFKMMGSLSPKVLQTVDRGGALR